MQQALGVDFRPSPSSLVEDLSFAVLGGTLALYGVAWVLPHAGLLSVSQTFCLCFSGALLLGSRLIYEHYSPR